MIYFSRLGAPILIAGGILSVAPLVLAHAVEFNSSPVELLLASASQGYLGVGLAAVDNDRVAALKLKDSHGAEIITVDQDAPAAKAGLRIHDVVIQMNGQRIDNVEQLRRMLRDTPPGRTVALVAVRDGQSVNLSVQIADRATVARQSIVGLGDEASPSTAGDAVAVAPTPLLPRGGSNSFLGSLGRNRYYVGVDLQPLPTGLAEYFGVHNGSGLLVGNVFANSAAANAGLRAADVIQKVNGQPIASLSDWEHAIHVNRGKQVQVTVIRDKKEQILSMIAGEVKNHSRKLAPESAGAPAVASMHPFDPTAARPQELGPQPIETVALRQMD